MLKYFPISFFLLCFFNAKSYGNFNYVNHFIETENAVYFDSTAEGSEKYVYFFPKTEIYFSKYQEENLDPKLFKATVKLMPIPNINPGELVRAWRGKCLKSIRITPSKECEVISNEKLTHINVVKGVENKTISAYRFGETICEITFRVPEKDPNVVLEEFQAPEIHGWNVRRYLQIELEYQAGQKSHLLM